MAFVTTIFDPSFPSMAMTLFMDNPLMRKQLKNVTLMDDMRILRRNFLKNNELETDFFF